MPRWRVTGERSPHPRRTGRRQGNAISPDRMKRARQFARPSRPSVLRPRPSGPCLSAPHALTPHALVLCPLPRCTAAVRSRLMAHGSSTVSSCEYGGAQQQRNISGSCTDVLNRVAGARRNQDAVSRPDLPLLGPERHPAGAPQDVVDLFGVRVDVRAAVRAPGGSVASARLWLTARELVRSRIERISDPSLVTNGALSLRLTISTLALLRPYQPREETRSSGRHASPHAAGLSTPFPGAPSLTARPVCVIPRSIPEAEIVRSTKELDDDRWSSSELVKAQYIRRWL